MRDSGYYNHITDSSHGNHWDRIQSQVVLFEKLAANCRFGRDVFTAVLGALDGDREGVLLAVLSVTFVGGCSVAGT